MTHYQYPNSYPTYSQTYINTTKLTITQQTTCTSHSILLTNFFLNQDNSSYKDLKQRYTKLDLSEDGKYRFGLKNIFKQNGWQKKNSKLQFYNKKSVWNSFFTAQLCHTILYKFLSMEQLLTLSKTSRKNKLSVQSYLLYQILYTKQISSKFWQDLVNYPLITRTFPQYYLKKSNLTHENTQYQRDLDRTFLNQQIQMTQQQLQQLNRLLKVLSQTIGYFQGLNYISAVFLSRYTQQKSYWFIRFLLTKVHFFQNQINKFNQFMTILQITVANELPNIFNHIQQMDLDFQYFASRWILTLYSYDTDHQTMIKLWKLLSLTNETILISFTICVLKRLQKQILECDEQSLNILLKHQLKQYIKSFEQIQLFEQTIKMYEQLRNQFEVCYYDESIDQQTIKNPTMMS